METKELKLLDSSEFKVLKQITLYPIDQIVNMR